MVARAYLGIIAASWDAWNFPFHTPVPNQGTPHADDDITASCMATHDVSRAALSVWCPALGFQTLGAHVQSAKAADDPSRSREGWRLGNALLQADRLNEAEALYKVRAYPAQTHTPVAVVSWAVCVNFVAFCTLLLGSGEVCGPDTTDAATVVMPLTSHGCSCPGLGTASLPMTGVGK